MEEVHLVAPAVIVLVGQGVLTLKVRLCPLLPGRTIISMLPEGVTRQQPAKTPILEIPPLCGPKEETVPLTILQHNRFASLVPWETSWYILVEAVPQDRFRIGHIILVGEDLPEGKLQTGITPIPLQFRNQVALFQTVAAVVMAGEVVVVTVIPGMFQEVEEEDHYDILQEMPTVEPVEMAAFLLPIQYRLHPSLAPSAVHPFPRGTPQPTLPIL